MENNKDVNQRQDNVNDNPYTLYYQKYLAKPTANSEIIDKNPIRPKQIISMILCGVSSFVMVFFGFIWALIIFSGNAGKPDDVSFSIFFLLCTSLAPAIVAKVLYHKSKWAVVNFICLGVFFVAMIVINAIA